ncbi:MAG: hypothetical protein K8F91_14460, partial [Candidatus Obscuribacterales bacterium]|nr:hypothetical protein [Candidatus Obscuribacterales bacterium]
MNSGQIQVCKICGKPRPREGAVADAFFCQGHETSVQSTASAATPSSAMTGQQQNQSMANPSPGHGGNAIGLDSQSMKAQLDAIGSPGTARGNIAPPPPPQAPRMEMGRTSGGLAGTRAESGINTASMSL